MALRRGSLKKLFSQNFCIIKNLNLNQKSYVPIKSYDGIGLTVDGVRTAPKSLWNRYGNL